MNRFGYARASAGGQNVDAQIEALRAAGCETPNIFRETGAQADRPQLKRLLATIGEGDVLIVSRLDRLAQSTRDLLKIVATLAKRGAAFRSLGDSWADATTPEGPVILTVLGGLAEFERELIRLRTGEGRARATARGQPMGRPPKLTSAERREGLQALASGETTQADLSRRFHVSKSTISRLADKAAVPSAPVRRKMDPATERAARAFLKQLEGKYPVIAAILYGSRARGDYTADSDADIAVILKGERGNRYEAAREMAGIEFHVLMETGVMVQGLPLWEDEFARPETFSNPALIQNILREGIHL
jgi:DNA invertase Pin-like site-specific DNA recombinase